jgi:5-methylcytosine-specific restriction endonuclease McrA
VTAFANCHYCGRLAELTRDHIVPRSMGGAAAPSNIVRACLDCNQAKGDTWPTCPCNKCENARQLHRQWEAAKADGWDRQTWNSINRGSRPGRPLAHHMDLSAYRGMTA